jgi:subtilisin family serine protease
MPRATPKELAAAIAECIAAGARVVNLSLALAGPSINGEQSLEDALNRAVSQGVIVAAAAGNQGTLGSSAITRHPWVIPVVACDLGGKPIPEYCATHGGRPRAACLACATGDGDSGHERYEVDPITGRLRCF